MTRKMKKLLLLAVMMMLATQSANAQFGALKGLAKKAKEKVQETTGNATENLGTVANTAATVTQGTAPWPMSGGQYKGKDLRQYLYGIADESDLDITTLRDQNLARYKSNLAVISADAYSSAGNVARQENQNFMRFLYELQTLVSINVTNVQVSRDGAIDDSDAFYLITTRQGGGIGYFVTKKDGKFAFVEKDGTGVFLNSEEQATAKQAGERMRKLQLLTYGLRDVLKADKENYNANLGAMHELCGMYANAMEKACERNTPENIERKARPAAGSLHASLKAQALAVAKADDPDVVDVIITSSQWDVKMKGAVPVCRNAYGYYIYKDEHGLQCCSRMWTEDYQGNGRYGALRKGGVGVGSPFYIK